MRRREFIVLLSGAAVAWPPAARAQQPGTPIVGFLGARSREDSADLLTALRAGLGETLGTFRTTTGWRKHGRKGGESCDLH